MLQAIRDRAMGVLGWVVIGLIIITFALFGLGSYLQDKSRAFAAKVNGVEISQRELQVGYQNQRARMEQMLGDAYNPALIDEQRLKQQALQSLISRQLLLQAAQQDGMAISDQLLAARIHSVKAFHADGEFSEDKYKNVLARQGMAPLGFEYETRQQLTAEQLVNGLSDTAFVTASEVDRAYSLQEQKRTFDYIVVSAASVAEMADPDESSIQSYYDDHQQAFITPERVRLAYLRLNADGLSESIEIEEQTLLDYYEEKKNSLKGQEQRRASHILFQLDPGADEATEKAVVEKAEKVLQQVRDGGDFAALASENSDDPGSAANGGDLGFFAKGAMVPAFEEAVFALQPGEDSGLVKSQFGYHIIRLTEIKGADIPALDDVREELIAELKQYEIDDLYYDQLEQLTDNTYESPDSLDAAADALGLEIKTSEWISAAGAEGGIGQYPKVSAAAFSEDVLESGNNSEPLEVGPNDALVIRVLEREAAHARPLADVRGEIVEVLKTEASTKAAMEKGEALLAKLVEGSAANDLATESGLTIHQAEAVTRAAAGHPPEIIGKIFRLARNADAEPVNTGFQLANGDYVVVQLTNVEDADATEMTEAQRTQMLSGFENIRKNAALSILVNDLRQRATIEIPEDSEQ
jgi:peptidyl-prolyl cis-trans isomerase D